MNIIVIGDPHFKNSTKKDGDLYIKNTLEIIERISPTFVVILGDVLDTHDVAKISPFKQVYLWLSLISKICPVYLIIGNHDLMNQNQFLTDNHFFYPLKVFEDPNITVVDTVKYVEIDDYEFVFCPYVPPGKFVKALNTLLEDDYNWDLCDCIFAHQEFKGCKMGAIISEIGDEWDESYPPVISGHIHDRQDVGENIFYTGSSIQHAFGENPNKGIFHVVFTDEQNFGERAQLLSKPEEFIYNGYFHYRMIDTKLLKKKIVYKDLENISSLEDYLENETLSKDHKVKLKLKGSKVLIKMFREDPIYSKFREKGFLISFIEKDKQRDIIRKEFESFKKQNMTYEEIFENLVISKDNKQLYEMYKSLHVRI